MNKPDIDKRVMQAVACFESGYNCAQSVFMAYCDLFELDMETAKRMSVSFGGGIGRMREVCGTVSAMAMLAGFKYPVIDPADQEARKKNYETVQKMANRFKERQGSIICRDLLKIQSEEQSPSPSPRTPEYYAKRPCSKLVAEAARIAGNMLFDEDKEE